MRHVQRYSFQNTSSRTASPLECANACIYHGDHILVESTYAGYQYLFDCYCQHNSNNSRIISDTQSQTVYSFRSRRKKYYTLTGNTSFVGFETKIEKKYCSTFFPSAKEIEDVHVCTGIRQCPIFEYWPPPIDEETGYLETDPCLCNEEKQYAGYCWEYQDRQYWVQDDLHNLYNIDQINNDKEICNPDEVLMAVHPKYAVNHTDWWTDSLERACMCGTSLCNAFEGSQLLGELSEKQEILMKCSHQDICIYEKAPISVADVVLELTKDCSQVDQGACGIIGYGIYNDRMDYSPLFGHYMNGTMENGVFQCENKKD